MNRFSFLVSLETNPEKQGPPNLYGQLLGSSDFNLLVEKVGFSILPTKSGKPFSQRGLPETKLNRPPVRCHVGVREGCFLFLLLFFLSIV